MRDLWQSFGPKRWLIVAFAAMAVVLFSLAVTGEDPDAPTNSPVRSAHAGDAPSKAATDGPEYATDEAMTATNDYLVAFFDNNLSYGSWTDQTNAHATAALAAANATVPRTEIPIETLTGLRITGEDVGYVEWRATMTGGLELHGATVYEDGRWRVNEVAPVQ